MSGGDKTARGVLREWQIPGRSGRKREKEVIANEEM
jgi:hypothetical protein